MRPVNRGNIPINPITGEEIVFRPYQKAKPYLFERIGYYCSFCEKHLTQLVEVEHILPKSLHPTLEFAWDNFLLACKTCNTIKGARPQDRKRCYWVDSDNTFRAFEYVNSGAININTTLIDEQKAIALRTLSLFGLNRHPNHPRLTAADNRWKEREDAWRIAQRALQRLQTNNNEFMREQILDTAKSQGFWSVWMTVFKNDTDMLQRLIAAFPGTCRDCFDELGNPLPRSGGNL
jgi:hypothetical protein